MVQIDYKKGLEKEQINTSIFNLTDEKSLVLSLEDIYDLEAEDSIIGQSLKILIRDSNYAGQLKVFNLHFVGRDKITYKILQKQ
jgi:hypothetical protein